MIFIITLTDIYQAMIVLWYRLINKKFFIRMVANAGFHGSYGHIC